MSLALDKVPFFQPKSIYCGYSLEAPCRGASNEYLGIFFLINKNVKY